MADIITLLKDMRNIRLARDELSRITEMNLMEKRGVEKLLSDERDNRLTAIMELATPKKGKGK